MTLLQKVGSLYTKKLMVQYITSMTIPTFTKNFESTAPDFLLFNAVDVDCNVEKEFCCERNMLDSNSYISIKDLPDNAFLTMEMSHSQFVKIGAANYDLKTVDSLFNVYRPNFIDSVYNEYLQGRNPRFLSQMQNKFYYSYIQHLFILNRIPVFRDCESGFICLRTKY